MEVTHFHLYSRNAALPSTPANWQVRVAVGAHGIQEDGTWTLTPDCVNEQEIDYWFGKLIEELKELRSRAKAKVRNI
jgi:uncharacterized protein YccT (UPF0319 family)